MLHTYRRRRLAAEFLFDVRHALEPLTREQHLLGIKHRHFAALLLTKLKRKHLAVTSSTREDPGLKDLGIDLCHGKIFRCPIKNQRTAPSPQLHPSKLDLSSNFLDKPGLPEILLLPVLFY